MLQNVASNKNMDNYRRKVKRLILLKSIFFLIKPFKHDNPVK